MAVNVSKKPFDCPPNTTLSRAIILREDPNESPNEEEIKLYASSIGIDLAKEPGLYWIAKEGITAPLPKGWQVMQDENNQIFYYNDSSGQSLWDHPLDSYYRRRVLQARRLSDPRSRTTQPTLRTSRSSSSRFSCSTFAHDSNHLAPMLPRRAFTPTAASSEKNSDVGLTAYDRTPQTPYWADTPLLGEESRGSSSVAENKCNVGAVFSMSETELPTEYCELVPSPSVVANGSKPHSLSQPISIFHEDPPSHTTATAAQTDTDHHITSTHLNSTVRCNSESNRADKRSEQLQQTVPTGAQLNGNGVAPNMSTDQQVATYNTPLSIPQKSVLSTRDTNRMPDVESPLPFNRGKDDTDCTNHSIMNSPAARPHQPVQTSISYPSLGSSPTENKSNQFHPPITEASDEGRSLKQNPSSHIGEQPAPHSSDAPVLSLHQAINSHETFCQSTTAPASRKAVHALPAEVHSSSPPDGVPVFNEGIHHLVEERSRLQRKMLRIKLIYNSYKQRLASLNSTLQLLHKTSTSSPRLVAHESESRSRTRSDSTHASKNAPGKPKCRLPTITTSPLIFDFPSAELSSPAFFGQDLLHSSEVVKPEVVNILEDIPISSHISFTNRSKLSRSLSTPRHTMSLRGSILSSRPVENHPSTACSHIPSPPLDLAHSLASIDAQLHRVIHHLESGDLSITCDERVNEKHSVCQSRTPLCDHSRLKPYWKADRDLEAEMQSLSIQTRTRDLRTLVGDLRLFTPVSPENKKLGFQCPRVDASPTWVQSD